MIIHPKNLVLYVCVCIYMYVHIYINNYKIYNIVDSRKYQNQALVILI